MIPETSKTYTIHDICLLLLELGATTRYRGFYPAVYSVLLCLQHPDRILLISKWVFPDVAKCCHTNALAVERNIRTLAKHIWSINPDLLNKLAKCQLKKCPSTKEFISILSTYLLLHKAAQLPNHLHLIFPSLTGQHRRCCISGQSNTPTPKYSFASLCRSFLSNR